MVSDALRRLVFQGTPQKRLCVHLDQVAIVDAPEPVCLKCQANGDGWVHVRMCLICGEVGCCDSSPRRHARGHFDETGHTLIRSIEAGDVWGWCYEDRAYLDAADFLL